ncbi:hypothetical protein EK904_003063 [Melospiza melodia maxima]|nr:hypothetical protein EK904_003063 [Melospiza melodia maxima]
MANVTMIQERSGYPYSWEAGMEGPVQSCIAAAEADIQKCRDAQAGPTLLNINAARLQVHLDVDDRLICSCSSAPASSVKATWQANQRQMDFHMTYLSGKIYK